MEFNNSIEHLLAEMERIDLLIAAHVARARRIYSKDEQFRGLYIAEEEVDALLRKPLGRPHWHRETFDFEDLQSKLSAIGRQINLRKEESLHKGIELRLHNLTRFFGLDSLETDALLVCLAVELDLRYERLYAYLQDDVTQKRPCVDLVLNLLTPTVEDKFTLRERFTVASSLLRHYLLEFVDEPAQPDPPLIARHLKVNRRIVHYLLGQDEVDETLHSVASLRNPHVLEAGLLVDVEVKNRILSISEAVLPDERLLVYLCGPSEVGRRSTAAAVCREQKRLLMVADLETMVERPDHSFRKSCLLANREAILHKAAVLWNGFDALLNEQKKAFLRDFLIELGNRPALTFIVGETPWQPDDELRNAPFITISLPKPDFSGRLQIWHSALAGNDNIDPGLDINALSSKFKFTGGQILNAVATAKNIALQNDYRNPKITSAEFYEACRLLSNRNLESLARKIDPLYRWTDIVLPPDRMEQLREICNHVKYREQVYGDWGFESKLPLGKGLSVLFAGPSGTGKTMAAEIIAGELGLELYKIDLSTVVSKYIGETEKNLSRIFNEAETSNSILFFDEADALFGKRSEVRDSHDRYANIEVGYLLQRMEEYEGAVILATNFRKNMDEAFVRRLHFTIEFPFPDEVDRLRIWERIFPSQTPRDTTISLDLVAKRFELSGGNIRNIALHAAFLAADDGGVVNMTHLLRATRREYQKMGKIVHQIDFQDLARTVGRDSIAKRTTV